MLTDLVTDLEQSANILKQCQQYSNVNSSNSMNKKHANIPQGIFFQLMFSALILESQEAEMSETGTTKKDSDIRRLVDI